MRKHVYLLFAILLISGFVLTACGTTAAPDATEAGGDTAVVEETEAVADTGETVAGFQIPVPVDGMYNVAFVYVGPHDDGGWSQSHDVGRLYVEVHPRKCPYGLY